MENLKDGAPAKIFSLKEAKTYDEQVALIKNKGFTVDDERECSDFLNQASYHRFSEYFLPFLNSDGICSHKVNFRRIQRIYEFDGKMRSLLLRRTEEIELYLRTQLAYFYGHKYGALGYLDETTFSVWHDHEQFLERVDDCVKKNNRSAVVRRLIKEYGGNFPIWVLIEFFSMGMLSNFYKDLKIEDQLFLAKMMYRVLPNRFKGWLRCLLNLRNHCAHCKRLYNWSFTDKPRMPQNVAFTSDHKLFAQIMTLKFLYPKPKKRWDCGPLVEIENLMTEYENDVSLKHIGFPENWRELLRKAAVQ